MLAMAGFREGSWYSPGYGVRMMVRQYEPAAVFAEDYVRTKVAPRIGSSRFTISGRASRQDLTQGINAPYGQSGSLKPDYPMRPGEASKITRFQITRTLYQ